MRKFVALLITVSCLFVFAPLRAQTQIKCGDIIEGEFVRESESFTYKIDFAPGDSMDASAKPFGDTLKVALVVYTPTGKYLTSTGRDAPGYDARPERAPAINTGILGGRGPYTLVVANSAIGSDWLGAAGQATNSSQSGTGPFTLYIGCTLRDGTVIKPGDTAQPTAQPATTSSGATGGTTTTSAGLPLVNATGAVALPLAPGQPTVVAVAPGIVYASVLNAQPGEKYQITITRQSGTAPLALTVYDPSKAAIFALAMGNSATFTTEIEIGTAGEHTLAFGLAALSGGAGNAAGVYQVTVTKVG